MNKKNEKPVQTSKFASSDTLDEVKDKEILPEHPSGKPASGWKKS